MLVTINILVSLTGKRKQNSEIKLEFFNVLQEKKILDRLRS